MYTAGLLERSPTEAGLHTHWAGNWHVPPPSPPLNTLDKPRGGTASKCPLVLGSAVSVNYISSFNFYNHFVRPVVTMFSFHTSS